MLSLQLPNCEYTAWSYEGRRSAKARKECPVRLTGSAGVGATRSVCLLDCKAATERSGNGVVATSHGADVAG